VVKADLSPEGNASILEEEKGVVLESDNVACQSLPKTSLNEGRFGLAKICDFIVFKLLGNPERKRATCIESRCFFIVLHQRRWVDKY